ncbi:MAG TPA: hypothetical protein VMW42_08170 [Desulfatiglandales bacterium]|nr:hypothetical protein [Desulfatiglandales bacterium]
MGIESLELYGIFEESFGKEKARLAVKDIISLVSDTRQELVTKDNLRESELKLTKEIEEVRREIEIVRREMKEIELKLTKEIETVRSSVIKWVAGLIVAQTGVIVTILMLLK